MIRLATRFAPRTFDRESRTVEAVAATAAIVDRGAFLEQLDLAGADLSQLVGAPLLDSHDQSSIAKNLGTITAARIEGGQLIVTMKLSSRADPYLPEIEAGTIGAVSVGYSVEAWARSRTADNRELHVAKRWTPKEVSFVSLPADPGARVRTSRMDGDEIEEQTPQTATFPEALPSGWFWQPSVAEGGAVTYAAAEVPAAGSRSAQVLEIQRRQAATPLRATVVSSPDEPAVLNARMAEALFARANPTHELSEPARPYFGLSYADIARDTLRRNGETVSGLGAATLITRALSTSDFPLILGDAVNRSVRGAYDIAPAGVQRLARQSTARDFRAKRILSLTEAPVLVLVREHGEFKSGAMDEGEESYAIQTFGRILALTRQSMINDDLGALSTIPARMGRAAREFEATQLASTLEVGGGLMSDGYEVFSAEHGNVGTGVALSKASVAAARLMMRRQTSFGGGRDGEPFYLNVSPRYLVIPPELEATAETIIAEINPTRVEDANPFATLSLVVEPRLVSATRWYLAADPATIEGLEYSYLESSPGPQIETRAGFTVDGLEFKVRLDFGAGWVEHRGWWHSGHA